MYKDKKRNNSNQYLYLWYTVVDVKQTAFDLKMKPVENIEISTQD